MKDLTFLLDGNPDFLKQNRDLINIQKYTMVRSNGLWDSVQVYQRMNSDCANDIDASECEEEAVLFAASTFHTGPHLECRYVE